MTYAGLLPASHRQVPFRLLLTRFLIALQPSKFVLVLKKKSNRVNKKR
jgi:hypothetical protein